MRDIHGDEVRVPERNLDPPETKVCPTCHALEGTACVESALDEYAIDGVWVREFLNIHQTEMLSVFEKGAVVLYGSTEVEYCPRHSGKHEDGE